MVTFLKMTGIGSALVLGLVLFSHTAVAEDANRIEIAQKAAGTVLKRGSFRGRGGHKTSGSVEIVKVGGQTRLVLKGNFRLDGAPDPRLAFGKGGYKRGTIFAKLKKNSGRQVYVIPNRIDVSRFTQVWLWCKKFNSPIGVAPVAPAASG